MYNHACFLWLQNRVIKGVYPASPSSWLFVAIGILATIYMQSDPSMGLIAEIQQRLPLRYRLTFDLQRAVVVALKVVWSVLTVKDQLLTRGNESGAVPVL